MLEGENMTQKIFLKTKIKIGVFARVEGKRRKTKRELLISFSAYLTCLSRKNSRYFRRKVIQGA